MKTLHFSLAVELGETTRLLTGDEEGLREVLEVHARNAVKFFTKGEEPRVTVERASEPLIPKLK
jgi:hypothetical protein